MLGVIALGMLWLVLVSVVVFAVTTIWFSNDHSFAVIFGLAFGGVAVALGLMLIEIVSA